MAPGMTSLLLAGRNGNVSCVFLLHRECHSLSRLQACPFTSEWLELVLVATYREAWKRGWGVGGGGIVMFSLN